MRFCTNCGEAAEGWKFCAHCGTSLDASTSLAETGAPADQSEPPPHSAEEEPAPSSRGLAGAPAAPLKPPETTHAEKVPSGRSRRGSVAVVGAVAGAGLIAAAGLLVFSGDDTSGDYPLAAPDLDEQPQLAWTLDSVADYVVKADNGLLIVSSGLESDGPVAYGVEPDTGEVRWTRENFELGFQAEWIWCYVPIGDMVACSAYGSDGEEDRLALLTLDTADGSQQWMTEFPYGSDYTYEVEDELIVTISNWESGDVEVSRLAADGTTRWTYSDTMGTENAMYTDLSRSYVVLGDGLRVLGLDNATGQPVPWLTSELSGDLSIELVGDEALRVEQTDGATSVERLDDTGVVVWTHQHAARVSDCNEVANEVAHEHVYLCSDDGGSVTALNWETGTVAWTVNVPDGATYAGETEDSVVFAGETTRVEDVTPIGTGEWTLSVVDVASGQQRWQRSTAGPVGSRGYFTGGVDLFPVSEDRIYAIEGVGRGSGATPPPGVDAALVAYGLEGGAESWRMPLPQLGDDDKARLLVVDGQLLLINGGEWIAAVQ